MGAKRRALLISGEPAPNEHARLLVEFLRRPDLSRRWMGALVKVDPARRAELVREVERLVAERFGGETVEVTLRRPPVQRAGYIEETEVVYRSVRPSRSGAARRRRAE